MGTYLHSLNRPNVWILTPGNIMAKVVQLFDALTKNDK